ncbi:hypothetical protein [Endozoicomonas sp. ALB091]|uniref:hypothetical protein n=1 Tax=Endozoicomonas sp. ALB091 TaxID=3403073 RepID=UPI003BB7D22B
MKLDQLTLDAMVCGTEQDPEAWKSLLIDPDREKNGMKPLCGGSSWIVSAHLRQIGQLWQRVIVSLKKQQKQR